MGCDQIWLRDLLGLWRSMHSRFKGKEYLLNAFFKSLMNRQGKGKNSIFFVSSPYNDG